MATKRINLVLDAPYSVAKQLKFQRVRIRHDASGQRYVLSINGHEFGGDSNTDIPEGEHPIIAYATTTGVAGTGQRRRCGAS